MKKIYILITFLFFNCIIINAQVVDVLDPTSSGITGFLLNDTDLYYTQSNSIYKLDITSSSPTPDLVIDALSEPSGLALHGFDLYFAQATANKVSKIDISSESPTVIDVANGFDEPGFLALDGNDLYISEVSAGKISKIDITATLPATVTEVATGLDVPLDILLIEDDLYIVEVGANKVSKIDISASLPTTAITVSTGFSKPLGLGFHGTDLYVTEAEGNQISKIDLTASLPITATAAITGLEEPEVLTSNATDLYFSSKSQTTPEASRIAKESFSTLSIPDVSYKSSVKIYPNPTTDYISVSSLKQQEDYIVYNVLGMNVLRGTLSNNTKIDVSHLINGMYFLKIKNSNIIKFIKQ